MNQMVGRLALRVSPDGSIWTAYYALPDSMEGAIWLGAIRMKFVEQPDRKQAFIDLMREAVADILQEKTGTRPTWPEGLRPAPESEREF